MTVPEERTIYQMTPREAWEAAWWQAIEACRHVLEEEATARGLEAVRNLARQFLDQESKNAPVAARDEAAELRAAVREWAEAHAAVNAGMDDDVSLEDFEARCVRFQAAQVELRRLAATEEQE